jgi:hypothetical protein
MGVGLVAGTILSIALSACSAQVPAALDAMGATGEGPVVQRAESAPPSPQTSTTSLATPAPVPSPTTTTVIPTTTVSTATTTTTVRPATTTTLSSTSTTLAPPPESFGDGTHIVGADIQAGRYEALEPGDDCSWQRLSGLSGEYRDVLADGNPRHRTIIDVLDDDAAVVTSGCGTWNGFVPFDEPITEFGPGSWAIGEQILPGRYTAPGGEGCFWATVTAFDGSQTSISAIARPESGPVEVTLTTNDTGVVSDNCGIFSRTG